MGQELDEVARQLAIVAGQILGERERDLRTLAASDPLAWGPTQQQRLLSAVQSVSDGYLWLTLGNEAGVVTASTDSGQIGQIVVASKWFQGHGTEFLDDGSVLALGSPTVGAAGEPNGALGAALSLAVLTDALDQAVASLPVPVGVLLFDVDGRPLGSVSPGATAARAALSQAG